MESNSQRFNKQRLGIARTGCNATVPSSSFTSEVLSIETNNYTLKQLKYELRFGVCNN